MKLTSIVIAASFLLGTISTTLAAELATAEPATAPANDWQNISDPVINALTAGGTKLPWPAGTGGVAVDQATGTVFMEIAGVGMWASRDHGDRFAPVAEGIIVGHNEFGYAMNADPAGSRIACFMLDTKDGKSGVTLDGGKTWRPLAPKGRGWDFAAVDWSDPKARAIFANRHEAGGEMYLSIDSGQSWRMIGKHEALSPIGICDANTLLGVDQTGAMVRSTDAGQTWNKVTGNLHPANLHPVGRVATFFNGKTWWLAREGLLTSTDKGATWQSIAAPPGAGWGPLFGKTDQQIVVADMHTIFRTTDGGQAWQPIAEMPPILTKEWTPKMPGQWLTLAWDADAGILYASRIGNPAYRLRVK
jgi:photosystem II stability/assembly factor-like uncharacterized protein